MNPVEFWIVEMPENPNDHEWIICHGTYATYQAASDDLANIVAVTGHSERVYVVAVTVMKKYGEE
jgi:hypothetical protein